MILLGGVVFTMGMLSTSVFWSFVILCVTGITHRTAVAAMFIVWPREAETRGVSVTKANTIIMGIFSFVDMVRSPILSALVGFGQVVASAAAGGYAIVVSAVFAQTTKKTALNGKVYKKRVAYNKLMYTRIHDKNQQPDSSR